MIGSILDIQKRKAAEVMKSEFVSTVSHELRTPMTSIMGAIGLVRSGKFGGMNPQGGKLLDIAFSNGERLVRLINDILHVEKIEAGKIQFATRPCAAAELIEDAIAQNERFAAEHNATISFHNLAGAANVTADAVDGMEAVDPQLIILDVMMPGMDGMETLERLRRQPAMQATPVIFMTAQAQPAEVARYREAGAVGVITKPFNPMTLADEVRGLWAAA